MITSRAKKVASFALLYFAAGLVVLVSTIFVTEKNKQKFAEVRSKNAEAQVAKQLASSIEQTLRLSEADRIALDSFFISERDTIDLITEVEDLAQIFGVKVETTQLSVTPTKDSEPSQLQIGFAVTGLYNNVANILSALETLPYHRTIPDVSIKKTASGQWTGSIVLHITLQ